MANLTRLSFLKKTSAGAVAIGVLGALPGVARASKQPKTTPAAATALTAAEPFVVYVRNPAAGELSVLIGTHEITVTDADLVARLWQAQAGRPGAARRAAKTVVR